MKRLNSPIMKKFLKKGVRLAMMLQPPDDGMLLPLFNTTTKNGWYYQIDYIHDERVRPNPYVAVWAFKPPRSFNARSATHFLTKEI